MARFGAQLSHDDYHDAGWIPEQELLKAMIERAILDFFGEIKPPKRELLCQFYKFCNSKMRMAQFAATQGMESKALSERFTPVRQWLRIQKLGSADSAERWLFSSDNRAFSFLWCLSHLFEDHIGVAKKIHRLLVERKKSYAGK